MTEWEVEVTGFERAGEEWLTLYVRNSREMSEEEVGAVLEQVPFCLKGA